MDRLVRLISPTDLAELVRYIMLLLLALTACGVAHRAERKVHRVAVQVRKNREEIDKTSQTTEKDGS